MTPTTPSDATSLAPADDRTVRLSPAEAFDAVRALLVDARYDEPTLASRMGVASLAGVPRLGEGRKSLSGEVTDANAALIRLFYDTRPLAADLTRSLLGDGAVRALHALGLLAPSSAEPDRIEATVSLVPVDGLWLVSDRIPAEREVQTARRDHVYGANGTNTREFLSAIPAAPNARVVELCAGSGVAALRALKQGAASAVATDITARAVHFTRFNARLNQLEERLRVLESDGWEALAGEEFDLVVAHPPYVPALTHRFDFRDAGDDGEQVTRKILEGLSAHLAVGGRAVIRAAMSDREGESIAQRVRRCLGEASGEFDLLQLDTQEFGPLDAYYGISSGRSSADFGRWMEHFHTLQVRRFAVCVFDLRRGVTGRAPMTERRKVGVAVTPDVAEWHVRWGRFLASRGDSEGERMAGLRPRVSPGVRVAVELESDASGGWYTMGATIETRWPSHGIVKAPALTPTLLELCDGTRDLSQLHAGLRQAALVDDEVDAGHVAHLIEVLLTAGAVEVPQCPLPPRPTAESAPGGGAGG